MSEPTIELRPFATLGAADHGWLDAHHHFSFSDYHDPARMGWGNLRVWNDDIIAAGQGFPPHSHSDMEIITYVRKGAITHRDNLGNEGRTVASDVQVMSAGTGIRHSEFNREDASTAIFQLWILPDMRGGKPHWGAAPFPKGDRAGRFVTLASRDGEDGALPIRADGRVSGATIASGESVTYTAKKDRYLYLVPAIGRVRIDNVEASARDGVAICGLTEMTITALDDSEIILVDTA
ncbi:MAG: pirin family protein [Pontixanthobacter sp.]